MTTKLLMPKATAIWLVNNTTLTFGQIAHFCDLHPLEVQGIADGEVATGIVGQDPVVAGQLTREEISRCEKDPAAELQLAEKAKKFIEHSQKRPIGTKYTPVARRQDKPDAIAWLVKHHPDLTEAQLVKLLGTTKKTIQSIRERSHWNWGNITPRDPVLLGLCTQTDLDKAIEKAKFLKEKHQQEQQESHPQQAKG